jgi:hypothetical protein
MSCYSVAEEITSIRADYLVERRGFEPMAIASYSRLSQRIAARVSSAPVSDLDRDYRAKPVPAEAISPGSRAATASRTVTRRSR